MGAGRGGRGHSGWGWGERIFPGGGAQEDKQRQCVKGRVFLTEVKVRAKTGRWDQRTQGRELGGSEGRSLGCRRPAGKGTRWWAAWSGLRLCP